MTGSELKLVGITVAVFLVFTFVFKQNLRRNAIVFLLACLTGFLAQLPLGRSMNLYTPNIRLYIFYVSVTVILAWGIGLTSIYATHLWAARLLRLKPGIVLFFLSALVIIVILEYAGSNIVEAKLHNYREYQPLMPILNSMHAPPWLYGYYALTQFVFYGLLWILGMQGEATRGLNGRSPQPRAD
jgi:hypothetical protein